MEINWYPGHMAKTKRIISEKIDLIDVVVEVLDGRMPYSSKIKDIDAYIKNKPRLIVMTKKDLCDVYETNKWIKYYENLGYKVLLVDLSKNYDISELTTLMLEVAEPLNQKRIARGMTERRLRALIVGVPNAGKSTLINRLVGKKAVNVGNRPGVTTSLDWIRINKDLELLDSPGVLWPKLSDKRVAYNLGSLTSIREDVLPLDEIAVHILKMLNTYYPDKLEERYGMLIEDEEDVVPIFDYIGTKRGCLIRGGEVDYDRVVKLIINDLKEGYINGVTFDRFDEHGL